MSAEHQQMMEALAGYTGRAALATVVRITGSSYRGLGARMLVLEDGRRIGSVSGGCIETEIARKAWWWTTNGRSFVRHYDTALEPDSTGYGLACNGTIDVLIEPLDPAAEDSPLHQVDLLHRSREEAVLATLFETRPDGITHLAGRAVFTRSGGLKADLESDPDRELTGTLLPHLQETLEQGHSSRTTLLIHGRTFELLREFIEPPIQLILCGAGFDAVPVATVAASLGWSVIVCDGRSDLIRPERFPAATQVLALRSTSDLNRLPIDDRTACVLMTHSFEQDTALLEYWLPRKLSYLGVLGARSRTEQMLETLGHKLLENTDPAPGIYAPAGLDIGAESPEEIALSILAEIRACFAGRTGGPLRARPGAIHDRDRTPFPRTGPTLVAS